MENKGRDNRGCFVKGRIPTAEEKRKTAEGVKRYYEQNIPSARLREQNPYIFNAWRAMLYTEKGKKAGCDTEAWKVFENFYADVSPTYKEGYKFHRIDINKPFSKDNFIWMSVEQAANERNNTIQLSYDGENLPLRLIALKYNQSLAGIKLRYHRYKDTYTTEQIIFGKRIKRGSKVPKDALPKSQQERDKASKMISSYKCRDKKIGLTVCDITIEWMIENILHKPCIYCGDTRRIGCDRIDNNKGHTMDNVVPCCCECNSVRNNFFSYEEMLRLGQTIREIKNDRAK